MKNFDLVVIGAGPGGYVAAIRGAHLGLKTAIVEKDTKLGGTCLLRGCIPTKSLLHSADVLQETRHALKDGLLKGDIDFDFSAVQKARRKVVTKSAAGVDYLMKKNGIEVFKGFGQLTSPTEVTVTSDGKDEKIGAKHVVLATGSVPRQLPGVKIDGKRFVTSDEILELKTPPKSLLVLGAGAVGMEFASIYQRFGTACTVVEMLDRVLPLEDDDVSVEMAKCYKKRGIKIMTGTKFEGAVVDGDEVVATLHDGKRKSEIRVEMILVAIGRAPVTAKLNLDAAGVKTNERGQVPVNGFMQTNIPTVYAIGDIVPTPQLAHTASAEAMLAVDHLAGKGPEALNYQLNPNCTYSEPEVASVGYTERAAKEAGYEIKVGKFPFSALGKARIMNQTDGFVKVISDTKYDEVLGVHIIGPRATDLIAEAAVALKLETTTEELAHTIHAHPTLPEALLEAAHAAIDKPIHM